MVALPTYWTWLLTPKSYRIFLIIHFLLDFIEHADTVAFHIIGWQSTVWRPREGVTRRCVVHQDATIQPNAFASGWKSINQLRCKSQGPGEGTAWPELLIIENTTGEENKNLFHWIRLHYFDQGTALFLTTGKQHKEKQNNTQARTFTPTMPWCINPPHCAKETSPPQTSM